MQSFFIQTFIRVLPNYYVINLHKLMLFVKLSLFSKKYRMKPAHSIFKIKQLVSFASFPMAVLSITMFTFAIVAVTILPFHATITIFLAWNWILNVGHFIKKFKTYHSRRHDHVLYNECGPFHIYSNDIDNMTPWQYRRCQYRDWSDRGHSHQPADREPGPGELSWST